MSRQQIGLPAWGLSLLVHALIVLPLLWLNKTSPLITPPPLALELWSGGAPQAQTIDVPATAPAPAPVAPPTPISTPVVPDADIKLAPAKPIAEPPKPETKPKPEPTPRKPETKPEPVKPEPAKPSKPEPASKPASKVDSQISKDKAAKPQPALPKDDLLAELDLPPGPGTNKSKSQTGSPQGVAGGSANGVAGVSLQYAQQVSNRVRPYVILPPDIKGNPEVVLQIEILPSLEVRTVRLQKSSGNAAYDQAVQDAVREMRRFPPLPKGAAFTDYRRITMSFRPKE